jgi:hypothetical protein
MDQSGEPAKRFLIEIKGLADLACRRAPAIRDAVGGHGRAEFSVTLVNVLNCLFAFIAARQIEIDVGPFASLFRKKSLDQQLHADRIDGGDSQ